MPAKWGAISRKASACLSSFGEPMKDAETCQVRRPNQLRESSSARTVNEWLDCHKRERFYRWCDRALDVSQRPIEVVPHWLGKHQELTVRQLPVKSVKKRMRGLSLHDEVSGGRQNRSIRLVRQICVSRRPVRSFHRGHVTRGGEHTLH